MDVLEPTSPGRAAPRSAAAFGWPPWWTCAAPLGALAAYVQWMAWPGTVGEIAMALALLASVLAAVHHAEVIAHKVGEPFGTLLFAVAVTVIEVGLIVSIMLAGGDGAQTLVRDTVLAAIMIIVNGVVGACLLTGGLRHREQTYVQTGVSTALATLTTLAVIVLILPNHVTSMPGPFYAPAQLAFVGVVSLVLYATFILVQTVRHRDYFLPDRPSEAADESAHAPLPSRHEAMLSGVLLLVCLGAVVWLAKTLAPTVERLVDGAGLPAALVGVVIAGLVLLPEGVAAVRAARNDRLQTSLNLAMGSALATIGLTIPVIAGLALIFDWEIVLGVDPKNTVILLLTLLVASITLSTGRVTVMQGAIHLILFAVFLFMLIVP
jgi:Ca2+:H+ antiporter